MELIPYLIQRDGGFVCYYCKKPLQPDSYVYEHLNSRRTDNRKENIALACQSCNIKKINDFDLQIMAKEKLHENEIKNFVVEKIDDQNTNNVSTEIDINCSNYDITKRYLEEIINTDQQIMYSDALNSAAFLCKEKTGHGSQQAVRNYIDLLTSSVGPLMIIKNENKKKIIVRRAGN
jgi:hypothetical protein